MLDARDQILAWSSNRLTVDYEFPGGSATWLHLPQSMAYYASRGSELLLKDAMDAALPLLGSAGFSAYDFVGIIDTSGARGFAIDRPADTPDGHSLLGYYRLSIGDSGRGTSHETLHLFGTADLYSDSMASVTNHFDIMGSAPLAPTPLTFTQWQIDWLSAAQVACLPGALPSTVSLKPMESSSLTGKKAFIVPIGTSKALTVEARSTAVGGAGCMDGVVISRFDTGVSMQEAEGIKVLSPSTGVCPALNQGTAGAWPAGSTYTDTVTGTRVQVVGQNADGTWKVTVTPKRRYANNVMSTAGLAAFWRLGEPRAVRLAAGSPDDGRIHNSAGIPERAGTASDGALPADGVYNTEPATLDTSDGSQRFNGTRWISVPTVHTGSDFTVSAWTKFQGTSAAYVCGGPGGVRLRVGSTTGSFSVDRNDGTTATQLVTTPTNANLWVHWAVTSSAGQIVLYRNGIEIAREATSATATTAVGGQIGASVGAGGFTGLIDDVAVFGAGLSATAVMQQYQAGVTP